jgi:hypothetical protein
LKTFNLSTALVSLLLSLTLLFPAQTTAAQAITVILDGRILTMDIPPVVRDNRTLLPMRVIFEALGTVVEWDAVTRSVTARSQGRTVVLQLNNPVSWVDGRMIKLDTPPIVFGGRTLVPTIKTPN